MCGVNVYMILWKWPLPPNKPFPSTPTGSSQTGGSLTQHHYFSELDPTWQSLENREDGTWSLSHALHCPIRSGPCSPSWHVYPFPWLTSLSHRSLPSWHGAFAPVVPSASETLLLDLCISCSLLLFIFTIQMICPQKGLLSTSNLNKLPLPPPADSNALQCLLHSMKLFYHIYHIIIYIIFIYHLPSQLKHKLHESQEISGLVLQYPQ